MHELRQLKLDVKSQLGLPVIYNDVKLELGFRIDILVEDMVIIEIKSVEVLMDVHKKNDNLSEIIQ
jgi:GxxExxY protein